MKQLLRDVVRLRSAAGFNAVMENALWDRLSVEVRVEVDRRVAAERNVEAIALMCERAELPRPGLHECVGVLDQRFTVIRERSVSPG
ncbi:hypothetical protein [Streptomyces sp. NPDC048659]|uniref:hypothetical protein n=1 Tax=Streptomyces sp. NPDC048659 TaxID=3155489 RepID=UPI003418FB46